MDDDESGLPRLSKRIADGEVDYKTKAGTAWSHSFLNQKPWHPLSYPNQRRKWIAEQTHAERERRAQEVAREYAQEQEFFRQTALVSKKEKEKMEMKKAVSFMYIRPPGFNAENAQAAEAANERKDGESKNPSQDTPDTLHIPMAPPEEKKKPRPKDVFGRALPTEEQFEVLKNAPRLETGVAARSKPFGVEIRNVKCLRCGTFGHQSGDRECPLKDSVMPNEESRLRRDDPLTAITAQTVATEPQKWELRQRPGMSPPRGGFRPDDPNQQIVAEEIFDEYGGFLSGDIIPELLTNFSKHKKSSGKKKHKRRASSNTTKSRDHLGAYSSEDDEERKLKKKKNKRKKRKHSEYSSSDDSEDGQHSKRNRPSKLVRPLYEDSNPGSDRKQMDERHNISEVGRQNKNSRAIVERHGHHSFSEDPEVDRRNKMSRTRKHVRPLYEDSDSGIERKQKDKCQNVSEVDRHNENSRAIDRRHGGYSSSEDSEVDGHSKKSRSSKPSRPLYEDSDSGSDKKRKDKQRNHLEGDKHNKHCRVTVSRHGGHSSSDDPEVGQHSKRSSRSSKHALPFSEDSDPGSDKRQKDKHTIYSEVDRQNKSTGAKDSDHRGRSPEDLEVERHSKRSKSSKHARPVYEDSDSDGDRKRNDRHLNQSEEDWHCKNSRARDSRRRKHSSEDSDSDRHRRKGQQNHSSSRHHHRRSREHG